MTDLYSDLPDLHLHRLTARLRDLPTSLFPAPAVSIDYPAARRQTIRSILALAACLIVPFLLLAAAVSIAWVRAEQARASDAMAAQASAVANDVVSYLDAQITSLRALAGSPALDAGDLARFKAQAHDLLDREGVGLIVRDPGGRPVLDLVSPDGTHTGNIDLVGHTIAAGNREPYVSGLVNSDSGADSSVVISVPVMRADAVRFILDAIVPTKALADVLRRAGLGAGQPASIADRVGRVIARSDGSPIQVGDTVPGFAQRVGAHGLWMGPGVQGEILHMNYQRLPASGWLISVGTSRAAFNAPLVHSLLSLGGLAVAVVLGAALMAMPLVRQKLRLYRTALAARQEMDRTAELLGLAQAAAEAGVWEWEPVTGRVTLSAASARLHGLAVVNDAREPIILSLEAWRAQVLPEDVPAVWRAVRRNVEAGEPNVAEYRIRAPHLPGGHRWVQAFGKVVSGERPGETARFVGLHLDVTARRAAEEALRASEARLRLSEERLTLALDSGEVGLFDVDLARGNTWVSPRWVESLGYPPAAGTGPVESWLANTHPEDRQRLNDAIRTHIEGLTPAIKLEYRTRCADGSYIWVTIRARIVTRDADDRPLRLVGTLIDTSYRKEAERRIAHMAEHDALTDLPNRRLFHQRLGEALDSATYTSSRHAVLACDIDRFKAVNDRLGHRVGDRLLCLVAQRIRTALRPQDTLARLGGDEFGIVLTDVDGEPSVKHICARIVATVGEPIVLEGVALDIGLSIGAALLSDVGLSIEAAFQRADTALYTAKAAGRHTYRLYEPGEGTRVALRSRLALDMREAIRRGDLFLAYQPVVDVRTGLVASFEALMRWRHPELGLVSPSDFIPVAEETGLIVSLGSWALAEACREAANWPKNMRVAVNVSPIQFGNGLEEAVLTALGGARLPANRLKLEVTESTLMQDADGVLATLHRLRGLGVRIALDDFGTGYSSLSYLRRFPFDKIKIDRAFVRDIADPDAAAIVRAVVGIGMQLGMGIVAEGVETAEQLDLVRREGCTEVQGFYFSKPVPAEEARRLVRQPKQFADPGFLHET